MKALFLAQADVDRVKFHDCNVRHRTSKTKGCLSRKTELAMAFKLMMSAQSQWRKLDGANRMPEIIQRIAFVDEIKQIQPAA